MKVVALLLAFSLAAVSPSRAADLSDPVTGHPGVTQFDLLKLAVTDLARDKHGAAHGKTVVHFDHIEGKDAYVDLPDEPTVGSIEVMAIPGDPSRELMLVDFGPSDGFVAPADLMLLFALDPKPRLLDITEVGNDRFVGWTTPPQMLAPGAPLILIESEHDNSNQTYVSNTMVTVRADRFRWIDTVSTFSEARCGFQRLQQPSFTAQPDKAAYASIQVKVVEQTKLATDVDCGNEIVPKPSRRVFETLYRWSRAKHDFVANNRVLERLATANAKRF
ncbi:MAG TPA: hypothetical protein VG407_06885 [Caulobacteraceae bacterium]|nr:hypothetical protein [Caulobacteraceae bacterium]